MYNYENKNTQVEFRTRYQDNKYLLACVNDLR